MKRRRTSPSSRPRVEPKPVPPPRSAGAVRLSAVDLTQEQKAHRLGVLREQVTYWETGARVPATAHRRLIFAAFAIPMQAWDEPASGATDVPAQLLSMTYRDMGDYLRGLVGRLAHMANESANSDNPKLFARYSREAVAAYAQLGRCTGETLDMSEERTARLPAVRRTGRKILEALTPWPEALKAVVAVLEEIEKNG